MGAHTRPSIGGDIFAMQRMWQRGWDEHRPVFESIADMLGAPADNRVGVHLYLNCTLLEHEANHANPVASARIIDAVGKIEAALAMQAEAEAVITAAMQSAPPGPRGDKLKALHLATLQETLPGCPIPRRPPNAIFYAPLRGEHGRMLERYRRRLVELGFATLDSPARSPDPAFDRAVGRLATLYTEWLRKPPNAHSKSGQPDWRSPFARIVIAFWPAIRTTPAPANNTIAAALQRVKLRSRETGDCQAVLSVAAPENAKGAG